MVCCLYVRGSLITYEGFDYTAGAAVSGQTGGTGWQDGWSAVSGAATVSSAGLTHPAALPTGGLSMDMSTEPTTRRTLNRNDYDGIGLLEGNLIGAGAVDGVLYGSLLVSSSEWTQSRNIISLYDWTSGSEMVRIQQNGNTFGWRLTDTSNTALDDGGVIPGETGSGTMLLVWKLEFNANTDDQMTLWVNPADGESSNSIALSSPINLAFTSIQIRAVNSGDRVDEIRFGTTFDAVAIPEPSMFGLLLATLSGAVLLRRRRLKH